MMFRASDSLPWYVAGLAFECQACGRCCAGPDEGFVWLSGKEISRIAEFLKMPEAEFRTKHVRKLGRRYSLRENPRTKDCEFLRDGKCRIYSVRPTQCRTWPFWQSNIETPEDWSWAAQRCPGVNRGELHTHEDIQAKAHATRE
jgi:hypothetical protein